MTREKPIKKYKVGGIQVAVWENRLHGRDGTEETMHNVTIERRYKDKQGDWKGSPSLRIADIPKAVLALNKTYEAMTLEVIDALDEGDAE